jgi:peptide methionine sulfoxide reductase msrA/msrB
MLCEILVISVLMATGAAGGSEDHAGRETSVATFAGGCFWCMEPPFSKLDGVIGVVSGYTGGSVENPIYEEVCRGTTGHVEAVRVIYDPAIISYEKLLDVFWRQIDPTDEGGQFADRGTQYAAAIFYHDDKQRLQAEASKAALEESGRFTKPLVTEVRPAGPFWPAEAHHQGYYARNPLHYRLYRSGSGRQSFLKKTWKEDAEPPDDGTRRRPPSDEELKKKLTPLQFRVTRQGGTEPPFHNEYWDNKREGIYVDIISGAPLFSSRDKYDSGTGWPSFSRPVDHDAVVEREDRGHGMIRREVRARVSDAHLGHVFSDGPSPTGLRYCMNSAALRFVPREDLAAEGYGEYADLFEDAATND